MNVCSALSLSKLQTHGLLAHSYLIYPVKDNGNAKLSCSGSSHAGPCLKETCFLKTVVSCQKGWLFCVEYCVTLCWYWGTQTPKLWLWGITKLCTLYFQFLFLFFGLGHVLHSVCVWPSGVLVQRPHSGTGVTTVCMVWRTVLMLNVQFM